MRFALYSETFAAQAVTALLNGTDVSQASFDAVVTYIAGLRDLVANPHQYAPVASQPPQYPMVLKNFSMVPLVGREEYVLPPWSDVDDWPSQRAISFNAGGWALQRLRREHGYVKYGSRILYPSEAAALEASEVGVTGFAESALSKCLPDNFSVIVDRSVAQDTNVAIAALRTMRDVLLSNRSGIQPDNTALEAASWLSDQRVRSEQIDMAAVAGASAVVAAAGMAVGGVFSRKEGRADDIDSLVSPAPYGSPFLPPFLYGQ